MILVDFEHERAARTLEWIRCADQLPEVGLVVRLRCWDVLGSYPVPGRYFLHDDGDFYGIEPAVKVAAKVTHWVSA